MTLFKVEMNTDIEAIIEQCPTLHFQVNKGERHRIMRSGIKRGSLWVTPRNNWYCVEPTGEVELLLHHFLHTHFKSDSSKDYKGRWNWWNITDFDDVAKVIRHFGEP